MEIPVALTFDDLLLMPNRSDVLPAQTDLSTHFSRNIRINIPIASAAMDTVTEAPLAIALARLGGIGIIHRNLPVRDQVAEVEKVKRYESGMVVDPFAMRPDDPIGKVIKKMEELGISGVPITEADGKLVGILTNRDLRFASDLNRKAAELMTPLRDMAVVTEEVSLEEAKEKLNEKKVEKLPVVDQKGYLRGLITYKDITKKLEYPNAAQDKQGRLRVGAAVGATGDYLERAQALEAAGVDVVAVDTAHGFTERVLEGVRQLKDKVKQCDVVAGNIAEGEAALALADMGADGVKVGMGPGSICTTRVVTGAGVPQMTAIFNVVEEARRHDIPVIADGGIKFSGDITKALAAGAHCVMLGNLLAGTDESPGELIFYQNRSYKAYRGMGSLGAMAAGSSDRYGQESRKGTDKIVPEGIEGRVPYKGSLEQLIPNLVGGVQSGMGYVGARSIDELYRKARFIRITNLGLRESHAHDVMVTKEAPNYRLEN
ncbi:MAG TPA: IMP dehydrogenase [Acidobacteriota bacterium]|nr:IMP dehydrogenase [Acidobacteriota bacterium]